MSTSCRYNRAFLIEHLFVVTEGTGPPVIIIICSFCSPSPSSSSSTTSTTAPSGNTTVAPMRLSDDSPYSSDRAPKCTPPCKEKPETPTPVLRARHDTYSMREGHTLHEQHDVACDHRGILALPLAMDGDNTIALQSRYDILPPQSSFCMH